MKNILLDWLDNFRQNCIGIIAIIGFFVQMFIPNINNAKINIALAPMVCVILLFIAIIFTTWGVLCKYYKKTFKFIELKSSESGNDVYWFKSDYTLNIGDILKLVEYKSSGIHSNLCIAKVQYKGENNAIGILPLIDTEHLKIFKSSSLDNLMIKPIYINAEEIKQLLFLIKNDNKKNEDKND